MSDQNVEKNQSKDQTKSVEEDYGLKKLTIYTLSISITCLLIAGIWYKRDDIPFTIMYDTTVEFYNKSTDTLSNSYNSIIDHLSEDKLVIQETARAPESKAVPSNETALVAAEIITEDVIVMPNDESRVNDIIEEAEKLKVTNFETEKAPAIVQIEKSTEPVVAIETTESIELTVEEADIAVSETPITENLEVTENASIKVTTEASLDTPITKKSAVPNTTDVKDITATSVISQSSPVEHQAPAVAGRIVPSHIAPDRVVNGTGSYVYSPYPYNASNSGLMVNRWPRNNIQSSNMGYMNQLNIIEQQRRAFEQNIQIQQQMMQQAFRMQSAIFKDADRRHQEMLKRVANWKAESQKRREFNKMAPFVNGYHY